MAFQATRLSSRSLGPSYAQHRAARFVKAARGDVGAVENLFVPGQGLGYGVRRNASWPDPERA